jgi:hypothetical protein
MELQVQAVHQAPVEVQEQVALPVPLVQQVHQVHQVHQVPQVLQVKVVVLVLIL